MIDSTQQDEMTRIKAMSSNWISKSERKRIIARDNCTCCYCNQKCVLASGMSQDEQIKFMRENHQMIATLDHIISQYEIAQACESDAQFRREIKNPRNLVTVCNGCNSRKKHYSLYIFAQRMGFDYAGILERIAQRIAA